MKKMLTLILALALLVSMVSSAFAQGIQTVLESEPDRKIDLQGRQADGTFPVNMDIPGESPVTGLPWDGYYMPMLVQIDNDNGGVDVRAPWGARYADIIYESPLHRNGSTRISFLFNDYIPDSVGPVRSARVGHVWLWYEWLGGFLFYGGQEAKGSNINEELRNLGYNYVKGAPLFSGMVGSGKPWKKYYNRVKGLSSPHNVDANVAAMQALIPETHQAKHRPYLFTDALPDSGDFATQITVGWKHKNYVCSFKYDEVANVYYRSVGDAPYMDKQTGEQISVSNVIIQRINLKYNGGSDKPITENVGQGNADIFIGGRYIPGYWCRSDMEARTIFFDMDGNEIQLQRGRTYIAMAENDVPVSYSAE